MIEHTWRELERADMDTAAAHRFDEERRAAMTGNRTTLLPCPFCGGEAELHPTYDMDTNEVDGWFVWCDNGTCECKPETGQFFTEAEAIAAWNRRAERTCRNIRSWDNHDFECSSCGYELYPEDGTYESDGTMNYCPNCGAKVVG